MSPVTFDKEINDQIEESVEFFRINQDEFSRLAKTLLGDLSETAQLRDYIHSTKYRVKDPEHLKDKLERKAFEAIKNGKDYDITTNNLYTKIDDLAGVRLLHLYTHQLEPIHAGILDILKEYRYHSVRKPIAYTWDIENKEYFEKLGFKAHLRKSLYTSVHYIIEPNRRTKMRCEVQVRTLAEEIWSEVSHSINYPHETKSLACKEQLKVLARVASGCTRLVDSIYTCFEDYCKSTET